MISNPAVNRVVMDSIPLNREIKRYWMRKFLRISRNSGRLEAERKFKHLKEVLLRYMSDYSRHQHIIDYYKQTGFRVNSYLKALFIYADCQPHYLLDFIKLYSYSPKKKNIPQWGTKESPHTLALATRDRLAAITVDTEPPKALTDWWAVVGMTVKERESLYWKLNPKADIKVMCKALYGSDIPKYEGPGASFAAYCRHHSYEQWCEYWKHQIWLLYTAWHKPTVDKDKGMVPEAYKDYIEEAMSSESFDLDYDNLCKMIKRISRHNGTSPLSEEELRFVLSYLSPELRENLLFLMEHGEQGWNCLIPELQGPRGGQCRYPYDGNAGSYVGHIHHIAKKGAGSDFRDIAVPNRLIQEALMPCWQRLRMFQQFTPEDASLDQQRFNVKITNRVNNQSLYVASVDLSKATDNLPRDWAWIGIQTLVRKWGWRSEEERKSFLLFETVACSDWEDQGFLINWSVGQPLGSLPSFAMLSFEHRSLIESLSLASGLGHSPYAIVGDDTVFFNKKLRNRYVNTLISRKIPLSLHKSYDGRLVEFAGQTFVKGCVPFYTTDHALITWNSLFDYQIATGVRIPWNSLPRKLRKKWKSCCKSYDPVGQKRETGEVTYTLAQAMLVPDRGSSRSCDTIDDATREAFEYYLYTTPAAKQARMPVRSTYHGMINLCGHPVRLLDTRFADKDGWYERFRPCQLPQWYIDKYRTTSTDAALKASCFAVSDYKDSLDDNTYFEPYGKNW